MFYYFLYFLFFSQWLLKTIARKTTVTDMEIIAKVFFIFYEMQQKAIDELRKQLDIDTVVQKGH